MNKTVAITKCKKYDAEAIYKAVREALGLIGFDPKKTLGKKVLLKPNMLGAYPPHRHITTHPAFVEAVAVLFREAGAKVSVGDSSNGVFPTDEVWNVTGIRRAAELSGAEIKPFESASSVEKNGIVFSNAVFEADLIVNLPKFKTHGLTTLTCAVKNLYGCVPGFVKTKYHREFFERKEFARLLVEISKVVNPELTIVDAITGMEGDGPSGGKLVDLELIIAGRDVHTVDAVCAYLAGLEPAEMGTLERAIEEGLFDPNEGIDLVGESFESAMPKKFRLPATHMKKELDWWISKWVLRKIWDNVSAQPAISAKRCKRCGLCVKSCPVDAISWRGKKTGAAPVVEKSACIQCMCCHEVCPYSAIDLDRSVLLKIGQWIGRWRRR